MCLSSKSAIKHHRPLLPWEPWKSPAFRVTLGWLQILAAVSTTLFHQHRRLFVRLVWREGHPGLGWGHPGMSPDLGHSLQVPCMVWVRVSGGWGH